MKTTNTKWLASVSLTNLSLVATGMFLAATSSALATVRYVNVNNASPTPPYTNWATAATNIQNAVDAAGAGDEIVVTNGTYAPVTVNTPLTLQSVNGPNVTIIDGGGAVRCLYLTNNATMVGFTLTNGWVYAGGGGGVGGESTSAVLTNCVLTGNSATGYYDHFLGYYVDGEGGGACSCTLNNCTLTGNSADFGGGSYDCTLNNCTLTGNSTTATLGVSNGGGAADCTLNNCKLSGNSAPYGDGGGACSDGYLPCTLNNCTLTGNSASISGGGAASCTLNNCIVYFNSAPNGGNYDPSSTLNYCCTTPMPTNGVGNISADPQLASASHLSAESPCIGAGSATYASGTDIDGEAWNNPPSIGCDEYHAGTVTGPLTVSLTATYTNVATGFPVGLTAFIAGRTDLSVWDFGDGFVQVNEPYTSHAWTVPGDYLVALWAFNDSYPEGVSAMVTVRVLDHPVQYVALSSTNPVAPYLSWATAATNIQDAVDAFGPGALVLVTNGNYAGGSQVDPYGHRTCVVDKPLVLSSVNGPDVTVINGGGTAGCVYLTNNAVMVGFTLTNGMADNGGGVYCESTSAVLSNCVLSGNSANNGGGAEGGTLNNCTLTGNSALFGGGGALDSTLNNCVLTGNSATGVYGGGGGGAYGGTLNNCTLTGNSATGGYYDGYYYPGVGGGALDSTLNNCIVYFNSAPNGGNYDPSSTLNYCCTTPMPTNGVGNISADPQLASASHLSAESPCIGAGSATYASGTDIDGEAWNNPPSIGCDEYHAGTVTGPLTVAISTDYTNVTTGFPVGLTAFIAGRTDLSMWDFGDGYVAVNEPYTSHAWTAPGDYLVALWAFNDSYPEGVSATVTVHVVEGVHYVAATSGNPVAPYTSWTTAATNIQDAVDVAPPGATIFVTNGTYAAGGRTTLATGDGATNRVAVTKPVTLRSVNGPEVTVINGSGTARCLYLTNDAVMVGFTLTNGWAYHSGGVYCESSAVLTNCVLTGNSTYYSGFGGGAYGGTLNNCTLTGNSALFDGGGAYGCTLNNCTLTGNYATNWGGGAYVCVLNNCIVYYNRPNGGNYDSYSILNYCCTTPLPGGIGNITDAPLFVNSAGGNLRLQSNSPCINAGNNTYVVGSTDLDGNPRIVFGTVDIGAYEYQTPTSIISYAWLQQYGLPTDGSADFTDPDRDGMNNWQEWRCGTCPTNASSALRLLSPQRTGTNVTVTWQSVAGVNYFLERCTNLAPPLVSSPLATGIPGQPGATSYTDTTATNAGPYFYRVGVGN
jgi:hypothetical protein